MKRWRGEKEGTGRQEEGKKKKGREEEIEREKEGARKSWRN